MNIGAMRNRMIVYKYSITSDDDGLGSQGEYKQSLTVWANVLKQRITPTVGKDDNELIIVTQGVQVRPCNVSKGDKVQIKNVMFNVIDVDISNPAMYVLTCECVKT